MTWASDYAVAVEISRDLINLVLDKFLQALRAQQRNRYQLRLGIFGPLEAELDNLSIPDLEDPPPVGGGVFTDLDLLGSFTFRLFGFIPFRGKVSFELEDVGLDFSATNGGLPKSVVIAATAATKIKVSFPGAGLLIRWLLNGLIGPAVSWGAWLAFRLIRKVEVPVWDLVDIFGVLGLRFAPGSPLLTAQKQSLPHSLLLASGFNLAGSPGGNPNQLQSFLPSNTNIGAVLHEQVAVAGVQLAFSKGWVPKRFRVNKWTIYLNSIHIRFEQDKIVARGSLKAKRGKCWCRVKAKISYRLAVEPKVEITPAGMPNAVFRYDADVNTQVSTSGMLVVIGAIALAPLFMSLTIVLSTMVNIVLSQFLPFTTHFSIAGGQLTVTVRSVHFAGFVPFQLSFPLQLSGRGSYDLTPFRQFMLPGNVPVNVLFTTETIAMQPLELRAAVGVS